MYKYYNRVNFKGLTFQQLIKIKADDFKLVIKEWQLIRGKALLKNISAKVSILYN